MTWNIHGTFNLNPNFDLEAVCSIIRKWSPDIVTLQEVDSRGRTDDMFGRLAATVGDYRVEAPFYCHARRRFWSGPAQPVAVR
jgi:endonuclease/exonuclease/phosphatase family metal-dependent hydrolase